jgi:Protein of unknown function (DUF1257)
MSHFTRVRTQLRNLETVKQALAELGYSVTEGSVHGYRGNEVDADLIVQINDSYDIGFRQEADQIVMVADFWGLRIDREEFLKTLSQKYAYLTIMEQAQSQGWQAMNEELQPDGSIRLVMQRWS